MVPCTPFSTYLFLLYGFPQLSNDSLFCKVISLNEHLLLKLLFLSRIIPPNPKQTKTLTSHLFKFLWNVSSFKPIKRSTLYLPKTDGGVFYAPSVQKRFLLSCGNLSLILNKNTLSPLLDKLGFLQYWLQNQTFQTGSLF